jgi:hypothetical protein
MEPMLWENQIIEMWQKLKDSNVTLDALKIKTIELGLRIPFMFGRVYEAVVRFSCLFLLFFCSIPCF